MQKAQATVGTAPEPGRGAKVLHALSLMGPAFIAGAWQFGPGNLASAVQAGSQYGYRLIWVIVVSTVLMIMFTDMSVRIGLVSQHSLVETVKRTLGRPFGVLAGVGVFGITLMFSVGNAVGAGLGLSIVFGGSPVLWTLGCTALVALFLQARRYYTLFERVLLGVIALMAVGFVATAFMTRPDWGAAAAGLVPALPSGAGVLLIALVGTNFSINAAFYTGYATRERGLTPRQYRDTTLADTIPGIVAPGVMTCLVIIAGAAVLSQTGQGVESLQAMAGVMEPIAGRLGVVIFGLGFAGAAFSSMLANATAGGSLLADGVGWGNNLGAGRVRALILLVLAFGAVVTVTASGSPVQLIIAAQALTVLIAPYLGLLLIILANHRRLMGALRNRWWQNVVALIGWCAILATSYQLVTDLL